MFSHHLLLAPHRIFSLSDSTSYIMPKHLLQVHEYLRDIWVLYLWEAVRWRNDLTSVPPSQLGHIEGDPMRRGAFPVTFVHFIADWTVPRWVSGRGVPPASISACRAAEPPPLSLCLSSTSSSLLASLACLLKHPLLYHRHRSVWVSRWQPRRRPGVSECPGGSGDSWDAFMWFKCLLLRLLKT